MSKSYCSRWCLCLVVLFTGRLTSAEDVQQAWRADFHGGNLNGADTPIFMNGVSKKSEPDRLILRSHDSVITLGGQFDNRDDYVELAWTKLGELSLRKNPMLEMRLRPTVLDQELWMEIQPTYVTAGGSRKTITFYASPQTKWKTIAWRLAGNDPLPEDWLPRALVGLSIRVHSKRPAEVEIDWVRLRGFNAAEQRREEEWLSLVRDGPPAEPAVLREFFPFGIYDASSDIGRYHITHRHAFDVMTRHHLNYKQAGGAHLLALKAGEQTGMRMSVHNLRPMLEAFRGGGADAAKAFAKASIDAVADSPVVIGYDIGDERPLADLWSAAASVRILEQLDPRRFSSLCFFTEPYIPAYNPYLCLYLTDIYPLGFGRSPEFLYEWCYDLARQTNNKRHWSILQSWGDSRSRRWRPGGILPSAAELRLMTYGSIAGGARGVIYYTFNGDHVESLLDHWVNPLNDLLEEVSRLGEQLIPIGRRLLDAEVDFKTVVENDNDHLIVGVLYAPKRGVNYLVVVNKDVRRSQTANLRLPYAWRGRKALDTKNLRKFSGRLRKSLLPGDGRIYMIGSAEQCRAEANAIRVNRIQEALRVMLPDISTAKSWKLDLTKVLQLQQDVETIVQQGRRLPVAERKVRKAGRLLKTLLAKCEPYADIRSQLDRIGQQMGKVEPAMYEDHRDSTIAKIMAPFREPYWQLQARWAEAYGMLLEGQENGLSSHVEALDSDCERLLVDVHKALANRSKYASSEPDTTSTGKESGFGATPPAKAHYVDGQDCLDLLPELKVVEELPLDGWLFKGDHDKVGVDRGYFKPDHPAGGFTKTRIGKFWDHQGYTVLEEGWYRLRYKCPRLPKGKRVFLHFGAVDESAWLYVDGELIAWYDTAYPAKTWNMPFLLEVTDSLKSRREHLLAVRVGNVGAAGGIHKPVSLMVEK